MALTNVARNALIAKQIATTTLVKPVYLLAPIPVALSTYVVNNSALHIECIIDS